MRQPGICERAATTNLRMWRALSPSTTGGRRSETWLRSQVVEMLKLLGAKVPDPDGAPPQFAGIPLPTRDGCSSSRSRRSGRGRVGRCVVGACP